MLEISVADDIIVWSTLQGECKDDNSLIGGNADIVLSIANIKYIITIFYMESNLDHLFFLL